MLHFHTCFYESIEMIWFSLSLNVANYIACLLNVKLTLNSYNNKYCVVVMYYIYCLWSWIAIFFEIFVFIFMRQWLIIFFFFFLVFLSLFGMIVILKSQNKLRMVPHCLFSGRVCVRCLFFSLNIWKNSPWKPDEPGVLFFVLFLHEGFKVWI